jgi:hypothetical protein
MGMRQTVHTDPNEVEMQRIDADGITTKRVKLIPQDPGIILQSAPEAAASTDAVEVPLKPPTRVRMMDAASLVEMLTMPFRPHR